jgi:hypothetical protein
MGLHAKEKAKVAKVLQSEHILEPLDDGIKDSGTVHVIKISLT